MNETRKCLECGTEFNPKVHNQKYCEKHLTCLFIARESKTLEQLEKLKLLSERQQNARDFIKKNSSCKVCGKTENLLVHHVRYSPIETVTLCSSCHSILHLRFLSERKVKPNSNNNMC